MCAVARRHPTVHLDFGGIAPKYVMRAGTGWSTMAAMMQNLLAGQVMYASDWPTIEPHRCVAEWRASGLPDVVLDALLCTNAETLYFS